MQNDTIVAISTPSGRSGIGVIRLSGQNAKSIAFGVTGKKLQVKVPKLCSIKDENKQTIDEAIVVLYQAPKSYTGDDLIEIQCHGNPVILNEVMSLCCKRGARPANPGEFTERAFRNGKMTLEKAEAVADLINSQSLRAVKSAQRSLSGSFSTRVNQISAQLKNSLVELEAAIDFSDETENYFESSLNEQIKNQRKALKKLITVAKNGNKLSMGLQVVLAGKPNVGKSSLLNIISSSNRAIVNQQPGTTRDTIEVSIEIKGNPIKLIDTAGIREDADEIEREGIARTKDAIHFSDVVLFVVDNQRDLNNYQNLLSKLELTKYESKIFLILNKIDRLKDRIDILRTQQNFTGVSAMTGDGVESLMEKIGSILIAEDEAETEFMARSRHIVALECALEELSNISSSLPFANPELLSEHYKSSIKYLSRITGEYCTEDLLGDIFSKFCIGK